jgi:phytoene desaturase
MPKKQMEKRPFSCSTFMIYMGLDTLYTSQHHHEILMADDYTNWIHELDKNTHAPEDMCVYVRNASMTDASLAPP